MIAVATKSPADKGSAVTGIVGSSVGSVVFISNQIKLTLSKKPGRPEAVPGRFEDGTIACLLFVFCSSAAIADSIGKK